MNFIDDRPRTLTRRAVTAGAAWSVPVIAAAAASPLYAASTLAACAVTGSAYIGDAKASKALYLSFLNTGQPLPIGTTFTVTLQNLDAGPGAFIAFAAIASAATASATPGWTVIPAGATASFTLTLTSELASGASFVIEVGQENYITAFGPAAVSVALGCAPSYSFCASTVVDGGVSVDATATCPA